MSRVAIVVSTIGYELRRAGAKLSAADAALAYVYPRYLRRSLPS